MKIKLFKAEIDDDGDYVFSPIPYTGSVPNDFRSNGFTYTPIEVRYHDTRFFLYSNKILNPVERKDLEDGWRRYCPQ